MTDVMTDPQTELPAPPRRRKAVWLLAVAPPAFVLVMGYTEALAGLLAVIVFYGIRSGRWWLAAGAGLLSGLCRPPGALRATANPS